MKATLTLFVFFLPFTVYCVTPQFWEENTQQQFSAGDAQSVSITSDGELILAPQLKRIYSGTDSIIWKILRDGDVLYAATGNDGKILKIDAAGKASILLDTAELEVQSMVLDGDGNLLAATSPDGRIYKIKKDGTSQIFYDPSDKYIWSLALDDSGNLYAATGDQGKIYRIDKSGEGKLFVDTNEANITALLWQKGRGLLAGSDKNGILYAIESNGKTSVLYDAQQQQITAIYRSPEDEIYFAAITGMPAPPEPRQPVITQQPQPAAQSQQAPDIVTDESSEATVVTTVETTPFVVQPPGAPARPTVSQFCRINPDGTTDVLYSSEDYILDIKEYGQDLLLSTGKKSRLVLLNKNKKSTILLKTAEDQITNLIRDTRTLVATANPGNIYELVQQHSTTGTFVSEIKDATTISTWGRITWKGTLPEGTSVAFSTRSGNTNSPDETWSAWQGAGSTPGGSQIVNPKGRFFQWKAELKTMTSTNSPVIRSVRIAYLQQNIRPGIDSITIHPPGAIFRKTGGFSQDDVAGAVAAGPDSNLERNEIQQQATPFMGGKPEYRKSYQTITWTSSDSNQDALIFDVYYRHAEEMNWKLMAKEIKENVYAWDTQTVPDGAYLVRITVSDRLTNPGKLALTNSREGVPFDVDNSAPSIEVSQVSNNGKTIIVETKVTDLFSPIRQLKYSVQPGIWITVFPVDSIDDSPQETYRIEVTSEGAEFITLKSTDQFNNTSTIRHPLPR